MILSRAKLRVDGEYIDRSHKLLLPDKPYSSAELESEASAASDLTLAHLSFPFLSSASSCLSEQEI